jgi:hypothetical protein
MSGRRAQESRGTPPEDTPASRAARLREAAFFTVDLPPGEGSKGLVSLCDPPSIAATAQPGGGYRISLSADKRQRKAATRSTRHREEGRDFLSVTASPPKGFLPLRQAERNRPSELSSLGRAVGLQTNRPRNDPGGMGRPRASSQGRPRVAWSGSMLAPR